MSIQPPANTSAAPPIPVVEERLTLERRVEETGALRVRVELEPHEETVELERIDERFEIERIPVGRVVEQRRDPWQDGEATVVPVYAEQTFVETRLVLVEEVRLQPRLSRQRETTKVPLVRQRAIVERLQSDGRRVPVEGSEGDVPATQTSPGVQG